MNIRKYFYFYYINYLLCHALVSLGTEAEIDFHNPLSYVEVKNSAGSNDICINYV
jgi:hypothetical protein